MAISTREATAVALYALVDVAAGTVVNLMTSSRKLRPLQEVDPSQCPALFITQLPEENARMGRGVPAKRTMRFEVWLYTGDSQEDSVLPISQLNVMVDAIEAAFAPDATTGLLTLGGLVYDARIEGPIEFYENTVGNGKSVAIIPIAAVRP